GGALMRPLSCAMPVTDGGFRQTGFRVMMGEQFGLCLNRRWKLFLKYLPNASMVLLPRALQKRLIRRILNERMLEEIVRLWWDTSSVYNLRFDQPAQLPL